MDLLLTSNRVRLQSNMIRAIIAIGSCNKGDVINIVGGRLSWL